MAVSKRTRFEVLRRDNYTCRYCRATDAPLRIDHVTPVALGGSDKPDNLVAACKDCNAGKSSVSLDSDALNALTNEQIAYERARVAVVLREEKKAKSRRKVYQQFADAWDASTPTYSQLPNDWRVGVATWLSRGLSIDRLIEAIELAGGKKHLPASAVYPYMAKVAWNWISDLEDEIKAELGGSTQSASQAEGWQDGVHIESYKSGADEMYPVGINRGRHDFAKENRAALVADRLLSVVVDNLRGPLPSELRYDPEPIV